MNKPIMAQAHLAWHDGAEAKLPGFATRSVYERIAARPVWTGDAIYGVWFSPVFVYQPAETAWSIIRPYPEDKDVVTARSVRAIDNFL
jgi:hypothetical protein